MTVRPILIYPHHILTTKAEAVQNIDADVRCLVADMRESLIASVGVGLAANQVGSLQRVILLNAGYCAEVDGKSKVALSGIVALVNPVITAMSDEMVYHKEGCLSIPHVFHEVQRPAGVEVEYLDMDGKVQTFRTSAGLFNAAVQHEIDHLDGIMFPDKLSRLQRGRAYKKLDKERPHLAESLNYPFLVS